MQAGRGFAKPFPKLPYMRGEGGILPNCQNLASRLPNCWRSFKRFLPKIKNANSICQTVGDALISLLRKQFVERVKTHF
jgi:hypothetical protein